MMLVKTQMKFSFTHALHPNKFLSQRELHQLTHQLPFNGKLPAVMVDALFSATKYLLMMALTVPLLRLAKSTKMYIRLLSLNHLHQAVLARSSELKSNALTLRVQLTQTSLQLF